MIMDHHPKYPPVPAFNQGADGNTYPKVHKSFGSSQKDSFAMPEGFTPGSTMMSATPTVISGGQENAMSFQYMKDIGISQMGTFEHYGITPSHKGNPLQGVEPMIANHRPANNMQHGTMGKIAKAMGLDDKENESEIRDRAMVWARGEGFTKDQLTEFDHLMGMISGSHINKNKLTGMCEIDRGSFGKIFKSTHEGSTVAVKQLANHGPATLKAKMRELLLELRVLVRVDHPNIVKFFGTATDFNKTQQHTRQPYVGLVFEFCERGSLHKAIFEDPRRLSVAQKLHIAQQMGEGLTYLHSKRIIHRDLNTRNILLTNNLSAKIADFGCARVISGSSRVLKTTTISGSPAYMAPEQMTGEPLTEAVDVWALAVMLWEVLMDTKPWEGRYSDFQMLKHAIVHGEKLHLPISAHPYPPSYLNAIKMGMQTRATNRPTMEALTAELKKANSQFNKTTAC